MSDAVVTRDRKPELEAFVRRLPAILSGRVPDEHGVAAGFRARIGWAIFSLIAPNFNELGRGKAGADGTKWKPLSPEYLAYVRPIIGRGRPLAGGKAPGGKDGLLTAAELQLWRRTFADAFQFYMMRESDESAKRHAAAVAWITVKNAGGKTKLADPRFGGRQAGVDYQMLVDTGHLRRSLQPGHLIETGKPDADYRPPEDQQFDSEPGQIVGGTLVKYAGPNHKRRRFWPERFPSDWWQQIMGVARSGLVRLGEVIGGPR